VGHVWGAVGIEPGDIWEHTACGGQAATAHPVAKNDCAIGRIYIGAYDKLDGLAVKWVSVVAGEEEEGFEGGVGGVWGGCAELGGKDGLENGFWVVHTGDKEDGSFG